LTTDLQRPSGFGVALLGRRTRNSILLAALGQAVLDGAAPSWAGTTERVSVGAGGTQADGASFSPSLSADGRFVAFESRSTNLVPGDTNNAPDVFVRDRQAGLIERVSLATDGTQASGFSVS
jgi:hypothetical protein